MLSPVFPESSNNIKYDERVDIWSMAVIVFEMLYGRTPFHEGRHGKNSEDDIKGRIRSLKYTFPNNRYPDAEDLFKKVFVKPQTRITLEDIL